MIIAIEDGLYNLITSDNSFNTSLGGNVSTKGRFYWRERKGTAEDPIVYPYAIGFLFFNPVERDSVNIRENMLFQVSIFQDMEQTSPEYIDTIADKAMTLLDDSEANLSFSGYKIMRIDRTAANPLPDIDDVKQTIITYNLQVQKI